MSLKRILVVALVAVGSLAVGASVASASQFSSDPVPTWLSSGCDINGVHYLSDDGFEGEGFGCDEGPDSGVTGLCVDGVAYNYVSDDFDNVQFVAEINAATDQNGQSFGHVAGVCVPPIQRVAAAAVPQGPDRYIFCAVAGNTWPDGTAIAPGTSLNLPADQVLTDDHYKGALIGFWVPGEGATCQLTPAQASLAAASTKKVNHIGGTGDYNTPEIYTFVG